MIGREVQIPGGPTFAAYPAYAALAEGAQRGVVVIFEAFGRQPEIDRVVERFAAHGYASVEPDLFAGCVKPLCICDVLRSTRTGTGPMVDRVEAARAWLAREARLEEHRIGVIGFCLGGGFALAVGSRFAAVSTNYGELPPDRLLAKLPPTIGCYGGRDRSFSRKAEELERRARPLGIEVQTHVFPEVGHSFLTDGHHPVAGFLSRPFLHVEWRPAVAEEGWRRIFDFFDRHL